MANLVPFKDTPCFLSDVQLDEFWKDTAWLDKCRAGEVDVESIPLWNKLLALEKERNPYSEDHSALWQNDTKPIMWIEALKCPDESFVDLPMSHLRLSNFHTCTLSWLIYGMQPKYWDWSRIKLVEDAFFPSTNGSIAVEWNKLVKDLWNITALCHAGLHYPKWYHDPCCCPWMFSEHRKEVDNMRQRNRFLEMHCCHAMQQRLAIFAAKALPEGCSLELRTCSIRYQHHRSGNAPSEWRNGKRVFLRCYRSEAVKKSLLCKRLESEQQLLQGPADLGGPSDNMDKSINPMFT